MFAALCSFLRLAAALAPLLAFAPASIAEAPFPGDTSLKARLAQFAPAVIEADVARLPESERLALAKIIEASRLLDEIFLRQAYRGNPELRAKLARDATEEGRLKTATFDIMRGPWDRQDQWAPFATDRPHPRGAGFYPEDMTQAEFEQALAESPEQKERFTGLFTLIERDSSRRLVAVPYSKAYREWLKPASRLLEEAAELTREPTLQRFLRSRAAAFLNDDYYQSDKDWMDLESRVEVTIGPYEVYEDELYGYKAAFEAFVTVADPEASAELERVKALLPEMEANLPIPDALKSQRGGESPIRVVDLVFSAGDARTSVQTIAFNLPNDERVRAEKGSKKVMLRNLIRAKFELILKPLAERIMAEEQLVHLSSEAFFQQTLFHELAHALGPAYVATAEGPVEVRLVLGATHAALEECKADVMGVFNLLGMIDRGAYPKTLREPLLASYLIGLFRSVRFGLQEAHGKGAAIQLNTALRDGGASMDPASGRLAVDFDRLRQSNAGLLREVLMIQTKGDRAAAEKLLAERAVMSPAIERAIASLEGVPVDLRPIYPVAGER
ncbi:MAG: hypothetical protein AB1486_23230 [Planctomycetota bacterium]